ncbi:hypothetical protein JNUCC1_03080 [Lentibacillus sp. JNUCC-1]|uniref:pilus assembly protein TadG-related protein n=1 Tax=Lentibacillus sp. JNUCC-1 TaxID=2654513 RepID=UPI0012E89007|nr:pilus assembly protein TadG-related protein [Lentibacillus sp. JNUCC-1]MUV39207.1 hypothetical protein [Lentibacillus sp. JNUCC-1]
MIQRCKKLLNNENGNTMLFVMGAVGLLMLLFVFVFNMGSAFVTKEKSAATASQASLAATSAFYEDLRDALTGEVFPLGEPDDEDGGGESEEGGDDPDDESSEEEWDFDEEITEAKENNPIGSLNPNEWEIEILEQVVQSGLDTPILGELLEAYLQSSMSSEKVVNAARQAVLKNGGKLDGAMLKVEDDRFKVKAANEFESTSFDGFMQGIKQKLYKDSAGPTGELIETLWTGDSTYDL